MACPVAAILALSLASALLGNLFRDEPLPWDWRPGPPLAEEADARIISDFEELESLLADPLVAIVDARDERLYKISHIPRAASLPAEKAQALAAPFLEAVGEEAPILIYCSDAFCPLAELLAKAFQELGRGDLVIFGPGFEAWAESGRPVSP
jgi:rhodanese-related sulfurtransferase